MYLYHGTTWEKAKKIQREGFKHTSRPNWQVPSRPGFVYLTTAYAPFFAMYAKNAQKWLGIVKVEVDIGDCYPDDDFLMLSHGKPVYTQEDLNALDPEESAYLAEMSVEKLGSVAVRPEDCRVVGIQRFPSRGLLSVSDPSITPMNYMIMGEHYRALSDYIYEHGHWEGFESPFWNRRNIGGNDESNANTSSEVVG